MDSSSDQPVRNESTVPVPGGFIRITTESVFVPAPASSSPATASTPEAPGETERTTSTTTGIEKATPNQVRKVFAEMHRVGEDLAAAYMRGHYGTTNPAELAKKTASELIRWLVSQPAKKG